MFDLLTSLFASLHADWQATQHVWLSPWGLGVLGLCIGSFLNVVVYRLPLILEAQWREESGEILGLTPNPAQPVSIAAPMTLSHPASRCPKCGHRIRWYENIPLVSWLALKARCASCKTPIPARYPLVEASTGLLFAAVGLHFGAVPQALLWCGVVAVLLAAALIDWDTTLLPDNLTQPLLWAALVAAALGWNTSLRNGLTDALWGAVAGYMSLWTVTWLFKLATGKVGMGQGDFKLLGALGAWLGASMVLPIVLGASVLGAVVGIGMKATGALREGRYVPFGPFLAGAGLVVLLAGQPRVMGWLGWY
jgi:leader peptidase (prepilin peptidase) / N-methyltransferase